MKTQRSPQKTIADKLSARKEDLLEDFRMTEKSLVISKKDPVLPSFPKDLLGDLRQMIDQARQSIATAINAGLTMLYWQVGSRIRNEILQNERAEYGEEIVATLSHQLTMEYGQGFTITGLRRMVKFAELFPDQQIVATLSHHLSWSHFIEILQILRKGS